MTLVPAARENNQEINQLHNENINDDINNDNGVEYVEEVNQDEEFIDELDEPYESEENNSDEDENNTTTVRGKWMFDNCNTIDEMIQRLDRFKEHLNELKLQGWVLREQVCDDYASLTRITTN